MNIYHDSTSARQTPQANTLSPPTLFKFHFGDQMHVLHPCQWIVIVEIIVKKVTTRMLSLNSNLKWNGINLNRGCLPCFGLYCALVKKQNKKKTRYKTKQKHFYICVSLEVELVVQLFLLISKIDFLCLFCLWTLHILSIAVSPAPRNPVFLCVCARSRKQGP